jgi:predicted nucleic acid-binding protein
MAFTVVYDACVLFPAPLRDLLIRLGHASLVRARWTGAILDECFHNIRVRRPELSEASLLRTRALMNAAVRDSLVTGYEELIDGVTLPDKDDRHVLAAAVRAGAQVIVTSNLKDFPSSALSAYGIEAQSPDDFVLNLLDLSPGSVAAIVTQQADALKNPPQTRDQLLETLITNGLVRSVAKLRELFAQAP